MMTLLQGDFRQFLIVLLPLVGAMMTGAAARLGRGLCHVAAPRRGDDDQDDTIINVLQSWLLGFPLVGAMMTARTAADVSDIKQLLPLVGAMMTGEEGVNRREFTMLLPLVGAMMTARSPRRTP